MNIVKALTIAALCGFVFGLFWGLLARPHYVSTHPTQTYWDEYWGDL